MVFTTELNILLNNDKYRNERGSTMKRIDRVYSELMNVWKSVSMEKLMSTQGSSASEIASYLDLTRSNVSLELNNLVRIKKVIKIKGYPVKYIPIEIVEAILNITPNRKKWEVSNLTELIPKKETNSSIEKNPFEQIIGSNDSLKKPISQAKAAIYYPPNGLHMLLLGPTGSGKTFFANKIYQYAVYKKILSKDAPFESFNCADYYHNPQLLLSQLFGYVEGSFTGAKDNTAGLVEKSNGGILLLDEIHRLTPEGQEMLFYFIDHGLFNRLGETGFKRKANVLIICATTEDPNSSLLGTFLRRIPMSIQIPSLNQRSLKERIELTKYLFAKEAKRINRIFYIDIDVINALIHTVDYGNVGQLKTQVQLICAQAFLNNLHQNDEINIGIQELPENIQSQWLSSSQSIKKSEKIAELLDMTTVIYPTDQLENSEEDHNERNVYELIEEKVAILEEQGIPSDQIHQYILTDLHLHVRNFVNSNAINYNLLKFVDPVISNITIALKKIAEKELHYQFDRRFIYYIGMHLDAYLKREKNNKLISQFDVNAIKAERKEEYAVAHLFALEIEKEVGILLPEIEIIYLTMLLFSIKNLDDRKKVSVLVVTHGNSTASSMVQVANELLGASPISALDMPLNVSPEDLFKTLVEQLKSMDQGRGVLMLVDMGSLAMFENKLIKETGIKIKTIANVTTSMVLDVVRKINYMDLDLFAIYHSAVKDFISSIQLVEQNNNPKAILSICTTGEGTAKKIETLITNIINDVSDENIEVIGVSILKMKKEIPELLENYHILASVGTKDPKIDAPYISLENLIEGQGEIALRQLINPRKTKQNKSQTKNIVVKDLCQDALKTYLVYLNPYHISDLLLDWTKELQMELGTVFSNTLKIKLVVHTAFAFERVVKKSPLAYSDEIDLQLNEILKAVSKTIKPLEKQLLLKLSKDEKLFISEVLINE